MAIISLIDNKYAKLVYDQDRKIVQHCFHAALDSENLRAVLNKGVDMLKTHRATKWLSDNREIGPHSPEDGAWVNNDWLPRAVAAGWKYWALVVPHDTMARMNMGEFVNSFYERGVRIMVFTDIAEAWDWLDNVDRT
jgi:hypothetical protein